MKLTDIQKQAAHHTEGPCLVLAVPGAGKTTMLLERINILRKTIDPSKILSLTFSRTQANDMKDRYYQTDNQPKSNFMTIHAFCYLIIRNYFKKQNRKLKILESDEAYNKYNLVQKIYFDLNGKVMSSEDLKNFFTDVGYMRNSLSDMTYLDKSHIKNVKEIYYEYEKFKRENGFIDFDDMQTLAFELINTNPRLLKSIKNKYKYIQLDEGQDTSLLQFKILEKIIYPENNLMVVADDDQSIYSFRAAEPEYLLNFKSIFPNATIITMDHNHRSQKNIVEASGKFIRANTNRYPKNLFTEKSPSSKINLKTLKNSDEVYSYILKNIDSNKTNAVLYRNNISSLNLVSNLMRDGIDFTINNGSADFFESKIIMDMRDIINFSEDPYNVEIFERIYYKIGSYLSKEEIEKLAIKPIKYKVLDFLYEVVDDKKAYNLDQKSKEFRHINGLTLDRKISFIYHHMGYAEYIKRFSAKYYEVIINKDLYIESLINFTRGLRSIEEFDRKIEDYHKIINKITPSNLILSTIHKSKGLEYDNVFIIDLVKNEFPMIIDYSEKEKRMEEERRVFYVGITRAREDLHLISLKRRNGLKVEPSPFYKDIKSQV